MNESQYILRDWIWFYNQSEDNAQVALTAICEINSLLYELEGCSKEDAPRLEEEIRRHARNKNILSFCSEISRLVADAFGEAQYYHIYCAQSMVLEALDLLDKTNGVCPCPEPVGQLLIDVLDSLADAARTTGYENIFNDDVFERYKDDVRSRLERDNVDNNTACHCDAQKG